MSSSKNKKTSKSTVRPYTVMCTDMYLLWILLVYPLYYADGYFHLPERKATFWCTSTLIYIGVTLLGVIITYISTKDEWNWERVKKNISMTDIFMFGFLISNLIAFALSEDKTNAWTGTGARYYGAKVLILVCISYFLISRYAWVNKVFIWAFLIGGNGVCLLATLDYFGMDVLGINQQMQAGDWLVFISTMGNANTCASYVAMALAGSLCYFCIAESLKEKAFAGISVVNCSMALITARSDSAYVGWAVTIVLLGVLAFIGKIEMKAVIETIFLNLCGLYSLICLRTMFKESLLNQEYDTGISAVILEKKNLLLFFIVIFLFISIGIRIFEKKSSKALISKMKNSKWIVLCAMIILALMIGNKVRIFDMVGEAMGTSAQSMFHMFSEETSTSFKPGTRAYMYQRAVFGYEQLPVVQKIFGCGHATISSFYNNYYGNELSIHGLSINSSHNNILDYLIIVGAFGVICYLGSIVFAIRNAFWTIKENSTIIVFIGCAMAYFIQGLFNIEQTNTTTIFWLMVAGCEAIHRKCVAEKTNI